MAVRTSDDRLALQRAGWQSALLGVGFEVAPFTADLAAGAASGAALAAGLAQGLAFSLVLCMSLAVAVRRAARLSLVGLVVGAVAWFLGAALHEIIEDALVASSAADPGPNLAVAAVRGLQYGCLGLLLGWVRRRPTRAWVGVGLGVGVVFGAVVIAIVSDAAGGLSTGELVAQGINEVFFPAGCALIVRGAATA
jgi:hypothetical protein